MGKYIDRNGMAIEERYDEVIDLTKELVTMRSHYYHEEQIMSFVKDWLINEDLPATIHKYEEKSPIDFSGQNVISIVHGDRDGPVICLNGHLDTVKLTKGWSHDAYNGEITDGKLYGLGALDMKSGCAAIMIALRNFKKTYPTHKGKIILTLVSDEEGPFGLGTNALIEDGYLVDVNCALVAEPSAAFVGKEFPLLCLGAKGTVVYQVDFYGKASHAAMPEYGINAAVDASKFVFEASRQVPKVKGILGTGRICPLTIEVDGGACSVPEHAKVLIHRHIVQGEDVDSVFREAEEIMSRVNPDSKYKIAMRPAPSEDSLYYKPYTVSEDDCFVAKMQDAIKHVCSQKASIDYLPSIGDFNYLGTRLTNVSTLLLGPGGENIHQSDEFVYLDTIGKTSDIIEEFLKQILL